MIAHISKLPVVNPESGRLNVVIDTPKGCRNKYKFDERNGLWRLSNMLPQGMSFPCDFGFIHRRAARMATRSTFWFSWMSPPSSAPQL